MSFKLAFGGIKTLGLAFAAFPQKFLNWLLAEGVWDDTSQWLDDEYWNDGDE